MAADWTLLPPELVEKISNSLTLLGDYIRFQSVCRAWRFSIPKSPTHLPPQLPWLMLPPSHPHPHPDPHQPHRAFFDLSTNTFHFLHGPECSSRKRYLSSSHGSLVLLDRDSPDIVLMSPLTRSKIHLPPLSAFPNVISFDYSNVGREYVVRGAEPAVATYSLWDMNWFLQKIILSCSPFQDCGFFAMAIVSQTGELAYCRGGDDSWKIISNVHGFCEDIIYSNGFFYAVYKAGQVVVYGVSEDDPSPTLSVIETIAQIDGDTRYLVTSGDELLLVSRYFVFDLFASDIYRDLYTYRTKRFEVYRLNSSGLRWWERVDNLGDKALFVGVNSSLSVRISDFSGSCTGNCIYYADDYPREDIHDGQFGGNDFGTFNLSDGSIEPLPNYPHIYPFEVSWPPPLWVSPNPC